MITTADFNELRVGCRLQTRKWVDVVNATQGIVCGTVTSKTEEKVIVEWDDGQSMTINRSDIEIWPDYFLHFEEQKMSWTNAQISQADAAATYVAECLKHPKFAVKTGEATPAGLIADLKALYAALTARDLNAIKAALDAVWGDVMGDGGALVKSAVDAGGFNIDTLLNIIKMVLPLILQIL